MRIKCSRCGKSVSSDVPDDTIIRAFVECPECIEKEENLTKHNSSFIQDCYQIKCEMNKLDTCMLTSKEEYDKCENKQS